MKRFVLSTLTIATLALSFTGCGTDEAQSSASPYPEKIDQSLLLDEGDNETEGKRRFVFNDSNGVKFKEEVVLAENYLQVVFFRPEGTVKEELIYFPQENGETRKLKSKIVMDPQGADYVCHKVFRKDGTVEVSGQRIANWEYATTYYFDDGESIERQVVYSSSKELKAETAFYRNGNPKQNVERVGASFATTNFRKDGTRIQRVVSSESGVNSATYFDVDGKKELYKFKNESYNIEVTIYPNVENISSATIRYTDTRRIYTVFGKDLKAHFTQEWKLVDGPPRSDVHGTYVLDEAVVFNEKVYSGIYQWTDITEINMGESGTHPKSLIVKSNNAESTILLFHPDGSVKLMSRYNEQGKLIIEKFPPQEMTNPVELPAELFQFQKFDAITLPDKLEKPAKKDSK